MGRLRRKPVNSKLVRLAGMVAFWHIQLSAPTFASEDHERAKSLVESGDILPLAVILESARRRYPGRLLETELEREDGVLIYEIEILTDQGRVLELEYDARTGVLLGSERDD